MNLNDEKEREQILKRFLPAIVILVVYFTFFKETFDEERKAAEQQYKSMAGKGITAEVLPALHKRKGEIGASVSKLRVEYHNVQQELDKHTSQLIGSGNVNKTLETLSNYFAKNQLHVTQADWVDSSGSGAAALPKSFNAVKLWLATSEARKSKGKEDKNEPSENRLREILFYGSYKNVYRAMAGFANRKFNVIPISLSMALPGDDDSASKRGQLKWVLKLWI